VLGDGVGDTVEGFGGNVEGFGGTVEGLGGTVEGLGGTVGARSTIRDSPPHAESDDMKCAHT